MSPSSVCTRVSLRTLDAMKTPSPSTRSRTVSGSTLTTQPAFSAPRNSAACVVPGRMPMLDGGV